MLKPCAKCGLPFGSMAPSSDCGCGTIKPFQPFREQAMKQNAVCLCKTVPRGGRTLQTNCVLCGASADKNASHAPSETATRSSLSASPVFEKC